MVKSNDGYSMGKGALSSYPVSRLAPPFDLVDLAREIADADAMLLAQSGGKLDLLARQIRALQEEARKILQETERDQALHRAKGALKKRPGQIYHFYSMSDGTLVISLLSPSDWQGKAPYRFEGSYRLKSDMTWARVEEG